MQIRTWAVGAVLFLGFSAVSRADERLFTYSYEASVLPKGGLEFEQWLTNQNGKQHGDYSEWDFRTELEYGVTENWTTSGYLNFDSVRSDGVPDHEDQNDTDFKGLSWENIYQVLNPNLDPVGLAGYVEYTTDGIDQELEGKVLLSKPLGDFNLVANAIYEAEWDKNDGVTEKEAELSFTSGVSYRIANNWSAGLEARWVADYPGGLDLNGREFQAVSVGPNVHYGSAKWWATLTVLPQAWGDGDGSQGGRNLVHEETLEARVIVGYIFE